jgi:NADPH:quinone reductase-like Zn-dependent oxidoreductase
VKANVQERYGTPEQVLRLNEIDRPRVAEDAILIRVRATIVNTPGSR